MRMTCVSVAALAAVASGLCSETALGQISINSVNEQLQAHCWIVSSMPGSGGTTDGGLNTITNNFGGSWTASRSSAPTASNNSSVSQQSFVSATGISSIGTISLTQMRLPSMTDVYHETFSRFAVEFEVLTPTQVEFDASVTQGLSFGNHVALSRSSPGGFTQLAFAHVSTGFSASYDGVLMPGTYQIYADVPWISPATRPQNSTPQTFEGSYSLSLVIVPAPATPAVALLGLAAFARRRR